MTTDKLAQIAEPRFYIDHDMIHDRQTGKHVTTDEDSSFCDGILACCALLNELTTALAESEARVREARRLGLEEAIKRFECSRLMASQPVLSGPAAQEWAISNIRALIQQEPTE